MKLSDLNKEQQAQLARGIEQMPVVTFENEHGEQFSIHSDGSMVFMSGDEVNAMVADENKIADKFIPLFNDHFNIWNSTELSKLGEALQQLTGKAIGN